MLKWFSRALLCVVLDVLFVSFEIIGTISVPQRINESNSWCWNMEFSS